MLTRLQDVAREAGVSIKTVSRVVNNENHVAEETRTQVLRVIDQLGYVPHVQAQRLASGTTGCIALHFPLADPGLISNQIEMSFITGVAFEAAGAEYFFSLMTGQMTHAGLLKLCRGARADGLVLMQVALDDRRVDVLREHDYPFVMIGRTNNDDGLAYIDLDFDNAIVEAYAHLINLGHRHIGFLTYSEAWRVKGFGPAIRSLHGFAAATDKFHIERLYRECPQEVERAYWTAKRMLADHPQLTAFVVSHNTMAVGVIRALQELDRQVPQDCSIVGIAIGNEAELISPALTAIEWSGYDIGRQAARMLIQELKGAGASPRQVLIAPKLCCRASTRAVVTSPGRAGPPLSG